jgi:hypothetical protein
MVSKSSETPQTWTEVAVQAARIEGIGVKKTTNIKNKLKNNWPAVWVLFLSALMGETVPSPSGYSDITMFSLPFDYFGDISSQKT